jgi:uncharacterized membrane protein
VADLIWLPAYLFRRFGNVRVARVLAVLALLPAAADAVTASIDFGWGAEPFVVTRWSVLLFSVLLVAALAGFHRQAPPVRPRPWLIALPIGIAVLVVMQFLSYAVGGSTFALVDWAAQSSILLVPAALVHLAAPVFGRRRDPGWSHAFALLVFAVLAVRVLSLLDYLPFAASAERTTQLVSGTAQAVVLLAVGLPLAALASRGLRRLPRDSSWAA